MSTAVLTKPAAQLHTSGTRLQNLFNAVMVHTTDPDSEDYDLSPLTQVHVEVQGDTLRLVSSDRFTMGIVREPLTAVAEGFRASFAVYVEDLRDAIRILDEYDRVSLVVEENALRITTEHGTQSLSGEVSKLPWRRVLADLVTPQATPTTTLAVDPTYLARFATARPLDPSAPLVARFAGEKGMTVLTLGTVFLGMIAPIDLGAALKNGTAPEHPLDVWFDLLDEEPIPAASLAGSPS